MMCIGRYFEGMARLKLWHHEGPKASLHVTSEGAIALGGGANWRQGRHGW